LGLLEVACVFAVVGEEEEGLLRVVISGHQWSSEVISGHQYLCVGARELLRGNSRQFEAIRGNQRKLEAIRGN
jgi:hypothetical protein